MQLAACVKKIPYGRVVSVQSNDWEQELTQISGKIILLSRRHWPFMAVGVVVTSTTTSPTMIITANMNNNPILFMTWLLGTWDQRL